jgi:hypothetical protein
MVFLKQASQPPVMVLAFDCEGPARRAYVLDNKANAGGTINLTMKWVSPSHLDVTYNGHATLRFQVFKYAGVVISVRDLSTETISTPHLGSVPRWSTVKRPKVRLVRFLSIRR